MQTWMWIVAAVALVLVVALAVRPVWRRRQQPKQGPGIGDEQAAARPDGTAPVHGGPRRRPERHEQYEQYDVRHLNDAERAGYVQRWRGLQREFAGQPATGLLDADALLTDLLRDMGYPDGSFDRRAADLSVEHADVTEDYRDGRAVVRDVREGRAGTEEIRVALLQYRAVFERLAGAGVADDEAIR